MEHLLGLLYSMLRSLPADSDARVRLLAKFVEKDYEKITSILAYKSQIEDAWASREKATQNEWKTLSLEEQEARGGKEWLSDQLDERHFTLEVRICLTPQSCL
jgi:beta-catenin-like protein 1